MTPHDTTSRRNDVGQASEIVPEKQRELSDGSTSPSLLERLREQHSVAWRNFVDLYSPLIAYWCQRHGLAAQERQDVLQEVFRTVATSIQTFQKTRSNDSFRGWLRTITRTRVADYFRRVSQEPNSLGGSEAAHRLSQLAELSDDSCSDPEFAAGEAEAMQSVYRQAIEQIKSEIEPRTWQAFWRVVVDGQSVHDVAIELSMRPGTVRVSKSRVLKRFRELLGEIAE